MFKRRGSSSIEVLTMLPCLPQHHEEEEQEEQGEEGAFQSFHHISELEAHGITHQDCQKVLPPFGLFVIEGFDEPSLPDLVSLGRSCASLPQLGDAGFCTVESISNATMRKLQEVKGISEVFLLPQFCLFELC